MDEPAIRSIFREELRRAACDDECPAIAALHGQRRRIEDLERRIAELETRPVITSEPIEPFFDHMIRPWCITYESEPAECNFTVTCGTNITESDIGKMIKRTTDKIIFKSRRSV